METSKTWLKRLSTLIILSFFSFSIVNAQTNTYAAVTGISGNVITLTVGHTGAFVVGEQALIIQMKGATITETNDASYGTITSTNGAGSYCFLSVTAVSANSVTVDLNVSGFDVNSNVQLISIAPDDGSGNFTENGGNEPPKWNGFTGGVYVMSVCGTYTLNASLLSNGGGFRGGLPSLSVNYYGSIAEQWVANDLEDYDVGAFKGEGVASTFCNEGELGEGVAVPRPSYSNVGYSSGGWAFHYKDGKSTGLPGDLCNVNDVGTGALANGGGGGGVVNGGGGGGGNGGIGGLGGCGWAANYDPQCAMGSACGTCVKEDPQGKGGLPISTTGNQLFLGGGGGGGGTSTSIMPADGHAYHHSQGVGGGVIYIIRATTVEGNGYSIEANGEDNWPRTDWQGNGGGGAGGSIYIDAPTANSLNLSAKGGYGGDVELNSYNCYYLDGETGPGGGGGGGVIISPASGTTNVTGGESGVYWDDITYGSKEDGTNWCAEAGSDGVVITSSPFEVKCSISELKELSCGIGCGTDRAAGQDGADLQVQVMLPPCSTAEPLTVNWSTGSMSSGLMHGSTADENNLCAGNYTVTVTDFNGVSNVCSFEVTPTEIDTAVSVDGIILTANESGATYQWLDCNDNDSEIASANSQTYLPTANGNYAVEITKNGCADTSGCHYVLSVGVTSKVASNNLLIYPNPTNGDFTVDFGAIQNETTIVVTDMLGKKISESTHQNVDSAQLNIEGASGTYFISIRSNKSMTTQRIIKK
ncbi:MAG: T9SS type A sorting domain-containing protein [Flavobacteriales bacterium]|nr:T9SS type A sorting domain-containing protein [Flavobacteriales bacterium]